MLLDLVKNASLLVALTTLYSLLARIRKDNRWWTRILMGLLFGGVAIAGMLLPVNYAPGIIYDGRSIILAIAGLFGGGTTALLSILVAGAYRASLGGNGVWAGLATIISSALLGLAFRRACADHPEKLGIPTLYLLGISAHLLMLACQLLIIPWPAGVAAIGRIWLPVLLVFPLATLLIGILLRNEDRRVQVEEKVQSQARFTHENPNPVLRLGREGTILYANPASRLLLQDWGCAEGDRAPSFWQQEVSETLTSQTNRTIDVNTGDITYSFFVVPILEAGYVDLYGRDVTERRQAERELRHINRLYAILGQINQTIVRVKSQEELFKSACQVAIEFGQFRMAWIGLVDEPTGQLLPVVHDGYEEGYLQNLRISVRPESPLSKGPSGQAIISGEVVTNEDIETISQTYVMWDEALKRGYRSSAAVPFRIKGKVIGIFNLYASDPFFFSAQEKMLLKEIGADISFALDSLAAESERKQAEEALRKSEENYRLIIETASEGIWMLDNDFRVTYVNKQLADLLGYTVAEVLGRSMLDFQLNEELPLVRQRIKERTQGKRDIFESRLKRKDGSTCWVIISANPMFDEQGAFMGSFSMLTDITGRKRVEDEVRQMNAELEQRVKERTIQLQNANKELESFSYSVSHDLRAPLRAVSGFAEIIARRHRASLNEEGRHYFDNIIKASERMSRLIDDLLTYSRLGRSGMRPGTISLAGLLAEVAKDFKGPLDELHGTLCIADDLPDVTGDRTLLGQIFTNLLDNAIKYHLSDVPPQVEVTWRQEGKAIIVRVSDNGIGIPAEYQDKIFNIFQRLHSEEEYPGTGLGLATVKKSVELLGGSVWVESEVGKGSTFYVRLLGG